MKWYILKNEEYKNIIEPYRSLQDYDTVGKQDPAN